MRAASVIALVLWASVPALAEEKKDEFKLTEDEQKVLDLTNAERKKAGVAEIKANAKLFAAARGHSDNMAAKQVIAHELDGKNFDARMKDRGYQFSAGAENCAMGQKTPAEAVESWMNSAGHRTNLLNGTYTEIGIGIAKDSNGRYYWTQVFGKPAQ